DLLGDTTNADNFAPRGRTQVDYFNAGLPPRRLEVMSADRGPVAAGFDHNFAYGTLEVGSLQVPNPANVRLVDLADNSPGSGPEALYVDPLIAHAGSPLALNGLHVYARAVQIDGTVVGGTVTQVPDSGPIKFGTATAGTIAQAGELDEWTFFGR